MHSSCKEEHTEEKLSFQKEKSNLFSDVDPQKYNSEKQLGMIVKTAPT